MQIGDKVRMSGEKQRYTIQAFDDRFVVLTKPFNLQATYVYTIMDLRTGVRSSLGRWGAPVEPLDTPAGATLLLPGLHSGEEQLSRRNEIAISPAELAQIKTKR